MIYVPLKTRRELLGVLIGATLGGGIGVSLTFLGHPFSELFVPAMAICGAVFVGRYFRGEFGWITYGTILGAVIADCLWSNPKFNHASAGVFPGALLGLVAGVIRDLATPNASPASPPMIKQDTEPG